MTTTNITPLRGVYAFLVTPTQNDGEDVDLGKLRQLIEWNLDEGVHGLCVFGSTGANGLFTEEEKRRIVSASIEYVGGRVPVVAGTGAHTTSDVVRMSQYAEQAGASAILVVPMNYWPLTENELFLHYRSVAKSVRIPIIIYNNPWTTGVDIKPPLVARLAEIDNILYIKESTGDLARISEIRNLTGDKLTLFAGWESTTLEAFAAGAQGWFSGMTNIMPRQCVDLFEIALEKQDWMSARDRFDRIYPLCAFMCNKSHVRVAHTALELIGRPMGSPRRPLRMLEAEDRAELSRLLKECGLLF